MEHRPTTLYLVMPPQQGLLTGFASGLIALANYVDAALEGAEVRLLDWSTVPPQAIPGLVRGLGAKDASPTFIGITATTASYQNALAVAEAFKDEHRGCVTLFGGSHATAQGPLILRNHRHAVDFVVIGEGERALAEFLRRYPDVDDVPGLAFLDDEEVRTNPSPPLLTETELDSLPVTFHGGGLNGRPGKFGHVTYVSARGCPLGCAFCAVGGQPIRRKSTSRVVEDLVELANVRGFHKIAIEDNFFAHSYPRLIELCREIAYVLRSGRARFSWDCQTRVESLARDGVIEAMAGAGCEAVYIGLESFNTDQLLYLSKTTTPEAYLQTLMQTVLPRLFASSVDCYLNIQFGLPKESDDHHTATIEMMRRVGALASEAGKEVTVFPQLHVVYPGTTHFSDGVRDGKFPEDVFDAFTKWEARNAPVFKWLGNHFAHGTGGLPQGILNPGLLRQGRFEVEAESALRVTNTLGALGQTEGVQVFRYGPHLVRPS